MEVVTQLDRSENRTLVYALILLPLYKFSVVSRLRNICSNSLFQPAFFMPSLLDFWTQTDLFSGLFFTSSLEMLLIYLLQTISSFVAFGHCFCLDLKLECAAHLCSQSSQFVDIWNSKKRREKPYSCSELFLLQSFRFSSVVHKQISFLLRVLNLFLRHEMLRISALRQQHRSDAVV